MKAVWEWNDTFFFYMYLTSKFPGPTHKFLLLAGNTLPASDRKVGGAWESD